MIASLFKEIMRLMDLKRFFKHILESFYPPKVFMLTNNLIDSFCNFTFVLKLIKYKLTVFRFSNFNFLYNEYSPPLLCHLSHCRQSNSIFLYQLIQSAEVGYIQVVDLIFILFNLRLAKQFEVFDQFAPNLV